MNNKNKIFTVGSLFAGVGGICLGFKNAKYKNSQYKLLWANEIDNMACETYRQNFSHLLLEGDINKILHSNTCQSIIEKSYYDILHEQILSDPIDILNGGFPCQAFSIAGEQKGFEDERGNLFLSIIDLIEQLGEKFYKPKVLFLENVKNLLSHDGGRTYYIIKSMLEKSGYTIYEKVLNTCEYTNLPQNRERIYIIGFSNKEIAKKWTLFDNIEEIKNQKTKKEWENIVKNTIDYNTTFSNNYKYYYTKEKYPNYFNDHINLNRDITEKYQFYQCRRSMYVRKNKSNVCPTLTANMGTGGHNVPLILVNDGIRKLTPKETFLLQGFPINHGYILPTVYNKKPYGDAPLYKQAGNAVSVPMIELLAKEILKVLID